MSGIDRPWNFETGTSLVTEFVDEFELDSLPTAVRRTLERTVIDTIGAIHAGFGIHETAVVTDYVKETFADGNATILDGTGDQTRTEGAIFANSIAANALDIDEGNRYGDGHPAAAIVPVALTVAEEQDASIEGFLEAVFVGYEVGVEAGRARREVIGHHTGSGSWAPIGAAAAAGRLRGLDRETLAQALGFADFNAPITPVLRNVANPGCGLTKDGIGWGGYVGITAVEMASRGLQGSGTLFDHEDVPTPDTLGDGSSFDHQYWKPYPTCRWTHAGIDAVRDLYDEHDVDPEEIQSVDCYSFEHAVQLATRDPRNADEAEYSYPYTLAVALLEGDVTPADLHRDSIEDETIAAMIDRISLHLDPDLEARYDEAWMARVDVHTDEETYSSGVTYPRGSVQRPMTEEDFAEKFQQLFADHPIPDAHEQVADIVATPEAAMTDLVALWR